MLLRVRVLRASEDPGISWWDRTRVPSISRAKPRSWSYWISEGRSVVVVSGCWLGSWWGKLSINIIVII